MSYYIKQGNTYRQTSTDTIDIQTSLPLGTYAAKIDDNGYYYERIEDFTLPPKLYGNTTRHTDRILNTFNERPHGTGVFLEGEKGSGKTLLAKSIAIQAAKQGVVTIVVNQPLCGEGFNTFIQLLQQDAVIIFDEFEKVYDDEKQMMLLSLFDGVYPTKKLFIVTCNDSWKVDKHMKNRPGRLFYMLSFGGLEPEFIKEYAEENLVDKSQLEGLLQTASMFAKFNFDMLKALVEEMNRYKESAADAILMLNTKPNGESTMFNVKLTVDGVEMAVKESNPHWRGNPFTDVVQISYMDPADLEDSNEPVDTKDTFSMFAKVRKRHMGYQSLDFQAGELIHVNGVEGVYVYKNDEEGAVLTLTKPKAKAGAYSHFATGVPGYADY